jgi:cytochrome P450
MDSLLPSTHSRTEATLDTLINKNESVDIVRWMPLFTVDVLGTTVLSRSFNAMKGQEDKELTALSSLLQSAVRPSVMVLAIVRLPYYYDSAGILTWIYYSWRNLRELQC